MLALVLLALSYPSAPRGDVPNSPYQWMEDLDSPKVKAWVEQENQLTFGYLDKLPRRDAIKKRLTELWDYSRTDTPDREGGHLFYRRNSGLQKQSVLYEDDGKTVLDPNAKWPDGNTAMSQWSVSPDGRWLVYSAAAGGSDLEDLHVRDLRSGRDAGVIPRVKFSSISWTRDSKGFLYARFKGTEKSVKFAAANTFHQIWYHPLRGKDRLVFERPAAPKDYLQGQVSDDGRWMFLYSSSGTSNNRLLVADLKDPQKPRFDAPRAAVSAEEDSIVNPIGDADGALFVQTTYQAPNGRIVAVKPGDSDRSHWKTIVPETADPINESLLVGTTLVVVRLHDVQSRLDLFDLSGAHLSEVQLPEAGSIYNLHARQDDPDFFFQFTSYLRPRTVYRYDLKAQKLEPFQPPKSPFDATQYETRALFYPSKDGTKIPIFITLRKGTALDGSHPAMLYAYGGFNIALQPSYSASIAGWLDLGGIFAVANLRGGSEYGEAWHHAGMREKKQNVFDDFIAAAEFLEKQGYTSPQHLAIKGGSNGGLLIGAVANQRPDVFGVALPMVGVMDMLRYQKFTGGALWADEYGSADDPKMLPVLQAYSPLHNIKPGCHPATLVTTADRDDRVVPSHSFKYAAALQAAQQCGKPVLIRVEKAGSHGYRPTDRIIAEIADQYAFALANL